jgi:hypothetical protein
VDFDWKVLAASTVFVNAAAISAAITVGVNIYCKVPLIAILFANAAAVTAAIAELPLLLWALSLLLPSPSCGGLLQSSCHCHHCICQLYYHQCMCNIYVQRHNHGHCHRWAAVIAVTPALPLWDNLLL